MDLETKIKNQNLTGNMKLKLELLKIYSTTMSFSLISIGGIAYFFATNHAFECFLLPELFGYSLTKFWIKFCLQFLTLSLFETIPVGIFIFSFVKYDEIETGLTKNLFEIFPKFNEKISIITKTTTRKLIIGIIYAMLFGLIFVSLIDSHVWNGPGFKGDI